MNKTAMAHHLLGSANRTTTHAATVCLLREAADWRSGVFAQAQGPLQLEEQQWLTVSTCKMKCSL